MSDHGAATDRFQARPHVVETRIGETLVLYDRGQRRVHLLDEGAATIWGMLDRPVSRGALAERLMSEGAEPQSADAAVDAAVAELLAQGVVSPFPNVDQDDDVVVSPPIGFIDVGDPSIARHRSRPINVLGEPVAFVADDVAQIADVDWYTEPLRHAEPPRRWLAVEATPDAARTFPARLNRVAADAAHVLAVHAGGVVRDGMGVMLPGGPGAGKSTLTASLLQRGFGYVSDEVVGVSFDGRHLEGFTKRLSLERGSWPVFPELEQRVDRSTRAGFDPSRVWWVDPRELHPSALDWHRGDPFVALGLVVLATYEAGAETEVERLGVIEALQAIVPTTFNLHRLTQDGLRAVCAVAANVPCFRLRHGGVSRAVPVIEELAATTAGATR